MAASIIKGYRVLRVPLNYRDAHHFLYIKEHADKTSDATGRVLFVGNVEYGPSLSIDQIDSFLRDVFSPFGDIESVSVSKFTERSRESRNARFAHVCFARSSAMEKCLQADEAEYQRNLSRIADTWGFSYLSEPQTKQAIYAQLLSERPSREELRSHVDEYMIEFEEKEAAAERERKMKEGVPDEDGFITVSYKNTHKRQRAAAEEDTSKKRKRKKKPATELKNFYRFQIREEKRERLADLRQKFEEDKARIARMKSQRKFKPF